MAFGKQKTFLKVTRLLVWAPLLFSSCAAAKPGRIIGPVGVMPPIQWTREEQASDLAIRTLRKTEDASFHRIRLGGSEEPHIHKTHDVAVFVLSGEALLRLGKKTYELKKGDVAEIPRNKLHWAENLSDPPCEVYAVFTPAFDGEDYHPVERSGGLRPRIVRN